MIHLTPSAEYEPLDDVRQTLAAIEELLETAATFADLEDEPPPGLASCYLQEAADRLKQAWLAVQTAAGRAQRATEAAARSRGEEYCLLCGHWSPKDELVRENTGYEGKDERKTNHWHRHATCGAPQ